MKRASVNRKAIALILAAAALSVLPTGCASHQAATSSADAAHGHGTLQFPGKPMTQAQIMQAIARSRQHPGAPQ